MQAHYLDSSVWFGHARLSILDLSEAASQPMATADSRYVISYNGEVYNYADLARSLSIRDLRTTSDTEVVLRAFAKLGPASIELFNGIFAFSIYDKSAQKVWLVRDRIGIKPLYYRMNGNGISFASEIKAIRALDDRSARVRVSAVHEWLYYGICMGGNTLYEGTYQLLPGHYLEVDLATLGVKTTCYWSPANYAEHEKETAPLDELVVRTRDLLEQAVRRQLVSDVPVGVFLSGGIDSSAITAFAARHYNGKITTYTAAFDFDEGLNELPTARRVAQEYHTDHHELYIEGENIGDIVVKMVDHHDMPFSDAANLPLYLLCSKICSTTKVVLQGDGGDELFGGYQRYSTLHFLKLFLPLARFGNVINAIMPRDMSYYRRQRYIDALMSRDLATMMALLLNEESRHNNPAQVFTPEFRPAVLQSDPFARIRECYKLFRSEDAVSQMLFLDLMITLPDKFLEKVDRATMAASVEVRVPFLDNDLVDFCLRLSSAQKLQYGRKKWLLKKALEGVVPHSILYRKKCGLTVPYGHWLRGPLRILFFDSVHAFETKHPHVLDVDVIASIYHAHANRRQNFSFLLWKVMNFVIWANRYGISFA